MNIWLKKFQLKIFRFEFRNMNRQAVLERDKQTKNENVKQMETASGFFDKYMDLDS